MAPVAQDPAFKPKSEDSCATVPPLYRRREPEKTALHEIVRENLEPFLQYTRDNYKNPLPKYVKKRTAYSLRRLFSADKNAFGAVLKLFVRVVEEFYLKRAKQEGIANPKTGMLTITQRFGGSLNFIPHIYAVGIDGVYSLAEHTGLPRFHFQVEVQLDRAELLVLGEAQGRPRRTFPAPSIPRVFEIAGPVRSC